MLTALTIDKRCDRLAIVALVEIGDQDVGTFAGEAMATALPVPLSPPVIVASFQFRRPEPW
jgi:hypothetical protein